MSRTEIRELLKQGLLQDALSKALKQYDASPMALWARMDLAWVYDALCKKAASEGDLPSFKQSFLPLLSLTVLQEDEMLYETICWRLRALIAKSIDGMDESRMTDFMQEVWTMIKEMPHPHQSEACSVLCKAFYRGRGKWCGFVDFMEWWGWDTFRKEDYMCEKMKNGKKMPISLAEGCHIACAKIILQNRDAGRYTSYIERLKVLDETHPDMLYPGYYIAKLLLASGGDKGAMLAMVLPFVRHKVNEFWAWQILADAERDDEVLYLACLLRAVHCKTQDAFLVKIYYQLASALIARHDYAGAKIFLQKYVRAKELSQSRLPADVCHWMSEPWFVTAKVKNTDSFCLQMDYMGATDQLLYADMPESPMCVSHVDLKSGHVFVVYGYQQRGVLKQSRALRNVRPGMLLMARLESSRREGNTLQAMTVRTISWQQLPSVDFVRRIEGKVTTNAQKTAYFVRHKNLFAFVLPDLYKNNPLKEGDSVFAGVVLDYQKSKSTWSWRCVELAVSHKV